MNPPFSPSCRSLSEETPTVGRVDRSKECAVASILYHQNSGTCASHQKIRIAGTPYVGATVDMRAAYGIEITQSTPQRERRQDDHARGDVPAKPKPSAQTETHVKAFNLQGGQIQCVQAAIKKATN